MYLSSKSTTLTAARCPTSTRRSVMSVGDAMSHTAMDLSLEHVTISPLLNLRCSTASLWWISVFRTSPVFTSQTLWRERRHPKGMRALWRENRHQPAPGDSSGWLTLAGPGQGRKMAAEMSSLPAELHLRQCPMCGCTLSKSHDCNMPQGTKETLTEEIIAWLAISHSKTSGYALNPSAHILSKFLMLKEQNRF